MLEKKPSNLIIVATKYKINVLIKINFPPLLTWNYLANCYKNYFSGVACFRLNCIGGWAILRLSCQQLCSKWKLKSNCPCLTWSNLYVSSKKSYCSNIVVSPCPYPNPYPHSLLHFCTKLLDRLSSEHASWSVNSVSEIINIYNIFFFHFYSHHNEPRSMNEIVLSLRTKKMLKTKIRNRTTRWVMARPEDRIVQYLTREKNFFCLIPFSGPSALVLHWMDDDSFTGSHIQ